MQTLLSFSNLTNRSHCPIYAPYFAYLLYRQARRPSPYLETHMIRHVIRFRLLQSWIFRLHCRMFLMPLCENRAATQCGARTYVYVRAFLTERTETVGSGSLRSAPFPFPARGTPARGTPQVSVLSHLLFNIAMAGLPQALAVAPDLHHAVYGDGIALFHLFVSSACTFSLTGTHRRPSAALYYTTTVPWPFSPGFTLTRRPITTSTNQLKRLTLTSTGRHVRTPSLYFLFRLGRTHSGGDRQPRREGTDHGQPYTSKHAP